MATKETPRQRQGRRPLTWQEFYREEGMINEVTKLNEETRRHKQFQLIEDPEEEETKTKLLEQAMPEGLTNPYVFGRPKGRIKPSLASVVQRLKNAQKGETGKKKPLHSESLVSKHSGVRVQITIPTGRGRGKRIQPNKAQQEKDERFSDAQEFQKNIPRGPEKKGLNEETNQSSLYTSESNSDESGIALAENFEKRIVFKEAKVTPNEASTLDDVASILS